MPGYLRQVTVAYYLQGLVPHAMPSDSPIEMMQVMFRVTPSLTESLIGLAAIGVLTLWLAARVVSRREYVLEQ